MKIIFYLFFMVLLVFLSGCWYMMEREPHLFSSQYVKKDNEQISRSKKLREDYLQEHKDLNEQQENLVRAGVLDKGLTKEQVRLIKMIDPAEIKPTDKYGATEAWIYKDKYAKQTLYFRDDILVEIE